MFCYVMSIVRNQQPDHEDYAYYDNISCLSVIMDTSYNDEVGVWDILRWVGCANLYLYDFTPYFKFRQGV